MLPWGWTPAPASPHPSSVCPGLGRGAEAGGMQEEGKAGRECGFLAASACLGALSV